MQTFTQTLISPFPPALGYNYCSLLHRILQMCVCDVLLALGGQTHRRYGAALSQEISIINFVIK